MTESVDKFGIRSIEDVIVLNGREVETAEHIPGRGTWKYGGFAVPVGLIGTTVMTGKSGKMTFTRDIRVAWETFDKSPAVTLRHRNLSRWVDVARMHPDDAEVVALAILEAVKKVREA